MLIHRLHFLLTDQFGLCLAKRRRHNASGCPTHLLHHARHLGFGLLPHLPEPFTLRFPLHIALNMVLGAALDSHMLRGSGASLRVLRHRITIASACDRMMTYRRFDRLLPHSGS